MGPVFSSQQLLRYMRQDTLKELTFSSTTVVYDGVTKERSWGLMQFDGAFFGVALQCGPPDFVTADGFVGGRHAKTLI